MRSAVDGRTADDLRRNKRHFQWHHTGSMESHICVSEINHCSKHYNLFSNGYGGSGNVFFRSYNILAQ